MTLKTLWRPVALAIGLATATTASADVIVLVDMNHSAIGTKVVDDQNRTWNPTPFDATVANTTIVDDAKDSAGNTTGIDFATTADTWRGSNNGGVANSSIVDWESEVTQDNWWLGEGNNTAEIQISGLNPEYTYDLVFYGSRSGETNRRMLVTIGTTTQGFNAGPEDQTTFTGVSSDASGNLLVTFAVNTEALSAYTHLSAIQLTEVVPEPGSLSLLSMAGALLLCRRRPMF